MIQKAIFPGSFIQGTGTLRELVQLISRYGSKALLLASPTVVKKVLSRHVGEDLNDVCVVEVFGGECSETELSRIAIQLSQTKADLIIGMGGGKTIDAAKISADRANLPVIVVPTIASTDAPCSGCAVTYTESGVFEAVHYQKRSPAAVLVDLDIIVQSPVRFLISGMGDALATWFEARSCQQSGSPNECGGLSTITGLGIAKLCYDTLLEYGYQAKLANLQGAITPAFSKITEANILLSGIGFESSGIAGAHAIHNGLTAVDDTHGYFHGEKVAFGVLATLHLNAAAQSEMEEVYGFCEKIGLPCTLADLGIKDDLHHKIRLIADKTVIPGSSIHHEPGEISSDMIYSAILMADAMGRDRK